MGWLNNRVRLSRGDRPLLSDADDPRAFERFYDANRNRVLVYFTRRTFDAEVAADLAAETFAVALESRHQFRGRTRQEEEGWLFAIARSQLSRFSRRGDVERKALERLGVDAPELDDAEIAHIEDMAELAALRTDMARALSQLSDDQAYCVRQRILSERSYAELAAELGVTEQVVRARVSRGLRAMADTLGDQRLKEVA